MSNSSNAEAAGVIQLVTVLLALIFLFVWPGPLRYAYQEPDSRVKIDRLTHKMWVYNVDSREWVKR